MRYVGAIVIFIYIDHVSAVNTSTLFAEVVV